MKKIILLGYLVVAIMVSACGVIRVMPRGPQDNPLSGSSLLHDNKMLASISPSVPPSAIDPDSADYILGEEDLIEVLVWKNAELSKIVFIRPDGKISLPLVGDVQAAGLTPGELKDSIKVLLRRYKKTPEVAVIVREINSYSVFLVGEVVQPGKILLRSQTTVLQAITLAGGFTEFANSKKIVLLRKENGRNRRIKINYKDILNGKNPESNIVLNRGDTILVP